MTPVFLIMFVPNSISIGEKLGHFVYSGKINFEKHVFN